MLILLEIIDVNNQKRCFSWWFARLELAFDVMNAIQSTGARLISAELIDDDQRIQLPIQAFDGDDIPYSTKIQQLEREWQQLLSLSINE
ncbi:hypothetical protein [Spirosoma radiotolerans]|uniref:Uncharacterized protein n=1 Tax=Spirosoma radiotolerans TaxID=1379870 RepID=A0A0E3ZVT3_9BACT|nr:hypothetical protein [Spirosoma radiotolerans]AKD55240.1 hypothetical protein SD10_10305 [Spirosoma radiotolerans]